MKIKKIKTEGEFFHLKIGGIILILERKDLVELLNMIQEVLK